MKYQRLPVSCDPSYAAFTECVRLLGPACIYLIHCGERVFWEVKALLALQWDSESPFTPVVNLSMNDTLGDREWYIEAFREEPRTISAVGSEGVW